MKFFTSILCLLCFSMAQNSGAQPLKKQMKPTKRTVLRLKPMTHEAIFNQKMRLFTPQTSAEGVINFGKTFLGNAYPKSRADTTRQTNGLVKLQPIEKEVLVVNLKKFDCVTFVENMVALTQTRRSLMPNFNTYKKNLSLVRYRNGEVDYAARLHYFSDWLFENQKRGILTDITKEIGGEVYPKAVFYMSLKKDTLYGNMADPTTFAEMKTVEENITKRDKFYISKERVADIESKIKNGDIIAITNRLEGMDMAHTGFAIWQNGRLHLLHASSKIKQVTITEVPLADYLLRNKGQTGIMVGRLNNDMH